MHEFGYDVSELSERDLKENKILIRQHVLETDIHPFVKGVTFKEVWQNKVRSNIGSTEAYFASLDDLIKMKAAAGCYKDLEDLKVLKNLPKTKIISESSSFIAPFRDLKLL